MSYNRAALNSELIAPMYFLAIPLTIITYINQFERVIIAYLPLLAVLRNPSELASTVTSGLKVDRLLFRFYHVRVGVGDLI